MLSFICLAGALLVLPSVSLAISNSAQNPPVASTAAASAEKGQAKDFWDKLDAASGIISGLLVAAIGFYAGNVYNRSLTQADDQRKAQALLVEQVQTLASFIPHLSGSDENAKRAALVLVSRLGNTELAVELSQVFSGSGATRALTDIASNAESRGAAIASQSLMKILTPLQSRVAALNAEGQRHAIAFVVAPNLLATTSHAVWQDANVKNFEVDLDGTLFPVAAIHKDQARDLAILTVNEVLEVKPIELADGAPQVNDAVAALQIDLAGSRILDFGHVKAVDVVLPGAPNKLIATDLRGFPGVSGAPVVNDEGKLLGIMHSMDRTGTQYLVSARDLFEFVGEIEARAKGAGKPRQA